MFGFFLVYFFTLVPEEVDHELLEKRTPRFPVSYSYDKDNGQKYFSPTRQGLKLKVDSVDDDVAHEVALTLAKASQRGGSPQVSQTPNRRMDNIRSSPVQNGERMHADSEMTSAKIIGSEMDEAGFEGSLGSMEADNGDYARDKNYLTNAEGVEACSGTEEGQKLSAVRGRLETEVVDAKIVRSSSQGTRKRSKKVLFGGDEGTAFDALQTLADLSLMMPATNIDTGNKISLNFYLLKILVRSNFTVTSRYHYANGILGSLLTVALFAPSFQLLDYHDLIIYYFCVESSVPVKGENIDIVDESKTLDVMPVNHRREKPRTLGAKVKGNNSVPGVNIPPLKASKLEKFSALDISSFPEIKEGPQPSITGSRKRKQKSFGFKGMESETHSDSNLSVSQKTEATDEGKKPVSSANQVHLPTKVRSRRKMDTQKPSFQKDLRFAENYVNDQPIIPIPSVQDRARTLKEKLSNCLSCYRVRRWCAFEWFYSAIDYPWFAKKEFVEYLDHVGLGHVPRLTRVEWGVIRSSLGKPRRFSEQFLKEEKEKLNQYRDSVRTHYTELRAGTREGLPTDLAPPLSVGQRVVALHPRTREIHDGKVLTVDRTWCRVQFERPELGVELVMDIDCMPLNPLENMPASLTKHSLAVNKFFENAGSTNANFHAKVGSGEAANSQQVANSQSIILAQNQGKEADVQALSELTRALDKKEAVLCELRRMNDEVSENYKDGDSSLKESDLFKKQYAALLVQLNEVDEQAFYSFCMQVSSALIRLRQRNTYRGNSPVTWPKPMASLADPGGLMSSFDCSSCYTQESGTHVVEIVESSRKKARTMVDAAMQAMSSLKEEGNNVERIEDAIDFVNNRLLVDDSGMSTMRSSAVPDPLHGSLASQDQFTSCTSNPLSGSQAPDLKLNISSDDNEAQIPAELITHCVATLLMIQVNF
ncbi:Protein always early 3 [Vitis vinifera]|uniref:Protein always early 3 n=1 Tax=Vitis vinifera TaxID=29760 RepID=A0A438F722_VITVI|nr:Protein always early 3 [Vitis vinifera]